MKVFIEIYDNGAFQGLFQNLKSTITNKFCSYYSLWKESL